MRRLIDSLLWLVPVAIFALPWVLFFASTKP